ncbi:MAG: thioredoxin family protein [Helicobacteraceae bacterium]|jgi:thiol:disulfide interchange protein|nr:thioredoxin family protein [Helicobacteraceae bacterium]
MKILLTLLLVIGSLHALSIDMLERYPVALKKAKDENKPLLIYLYMLNCRTCDYMNKEVFTDKRVIDFLSKNYIVVKLYTNNRDLPKELQAEMSPVFHFYNARDSEMIESIIGGRNAERFLGMLENSYADYSEEREE